MKKLCNTLLSDRLIMRVISPEKGIDGPGFLSIFLFQTVLATAAGLITGKSAVVFVLSLLLFSRLVRARMNTATAVRYLAIPVAAVMSAGITGSVMIERYLIYFYDFNLLTRGLNIESSIMHLSVIAVRIMIASCILLTLLTVVLLSLFPYKEKSWMRWMRKNAVPLFSVSGEAGRTSYIYLMFIIRVAAVVITVLTAGSVVFLSIKVRDINTPSSPVIAVLIAASLFFCLIFFASVCAIIRRIRDLGRTWIFLALVIILTLIAAVSFLAFNPAVSNLLFAYAGESLGLSLMYWFNFYVSPFLGDILAGIRAVWGCVVLYLTFYPGKIKEKY